MRSGRSRSPDKSQGPVHCSKPTAAHVLQSAEPAIECAGAIVSRNGSGFGLDVHYDQLRSSTQLYAVLRCATPRDEFHVHRPMTGAENIFGKKFFERA